MLYDGSNEVRTLFLLFVVWTAISIGTCKACEYIGNKVKVNVEFVK